MRGSITKKLVMTFSAVLGVFLIITVLLLNITARKYMENTIIKNLYTESAIIEELYHERVALSPGKNSNDADADENKKLIKLWFSDIDRLADIGFSSDIALVLKTDDAHFGIFTPGESENEINFSSISADDLSSRLKNDPYFFSITGGETSFYAVSRPLSKGRENAALRAWIITYTPINELNHLVRDMNLKASYAIGISLMVAAFLSWYLSIKISKPIKTLKIYAEKIASRDFNARVNINTGDEIETLGHAMNKIAGDLSEYGVSQRRFLQNVTHELKTPVMSIAGYAEGIRDGVIEDRDKALNVIIGECGRLQRLVNEVLYLSKLETVEEFYSFKSENICEVLTDIKDKMQSIADKAGIALKFRLDRDCFVEMDRDKLTQAFINLFSNAVRYAKSEIVVEDRVGNDNVNITVKDDGPGIDEQDLAQVFERFYKGEKGNTGLGLTITKAIVEKHRGIITAANRPEGGAVFEVVLPVKSAGQR